MYNKLGLSLYLSSFEEQKKSFEQLAGSKYIVFTSFHIQEELDKLKNVKTLTKEMCEWLHNNEFKIIGDVSPKTLQYFDYTHIKDFAKDMNIDILRLDYGFSDETILNLADEYPIAFNASTVNAELAKQVKEIGSEVYALHNFYPRPETGLDEHYFKETNKYLNDLEIKVIAFIPGDELRRGPINEGLPTLEKHRSIKPYTAFLDLAINFGLSSIIIGDIKLSDVQRKLITEYLESKIIQLPVKFDENYHYLYNEVFTIRLDSPHPIMRLKESREYSCNGSNQEPYNCLERVIGCITMDNERYKRYSGEIQILRKDFPQDDRVNIIGKIEEAYLEILNCIKNGTKIKFIAL